MTYVPGSGRWSTTGAAVLTDLEQRRRAGHGAEHDRLRLRRHRRRNRDRGDQPRAGRRQRNADLPGQRRRGPRRRRRSTTWRRSPTTTASAWSVRSPPTRLRSPSTRAPRSRSSARRFRPRRRARRSRSPTSLTNTGNATDVFDITIGAGTFPVGTSYSLFQADGVTPLTDSDGNFVPDTGPGRPGRVAHRRPARHAAAGGDRRAVPGAEDRHLGRRPRPVGHRDRRPDHDHGEHRRRDEQRPAAGRPRHGAGPEGAAVVSLNAEPGHHRALHAARQQHQHGDGQLRHDARARTVRSRR